MGPHKPDSILESTNWRDSSEARLAQAQREAVPLEEGEILNEHYSYDDYVTRRANFLGQLEEYRWQNSMLFESARRSAEQVFESDGSCTLSVQEVRRREERFEEFPLLPLPTKSNTQTINDFQDYPCEEWAAPATPEARTPSYSPFHPPTATPIRIGSVAPPTPGPLQSIRDKTRSPTAASRGPVRDTALTANQGVIPKSTSAPTSSEQVVRNSIAPHTLPSRQDSAQPEAARAKTSPYTVNTQIPQPTAQEKTISAERKPGLRPPLQRVLVSAYAGRGTNVPIKFRPRGKRSRVENSEEDAPFETDSETASMPPNKRIKSKLDASQLDDSMSKMFKVEEKSTATLIRRSKRKDKMDEDGQKAVETGNVRTSPPRSNKQKRTVDIEDVIEGRCLPGSAEQARAASVERRARLLQQHNAQQQQQAKVRARRTRARNSEPDLMPEFFNVRNFPRSMRDETVRCICGQTSDDGKHMLSCDRCSVWEHTACIGDAAPANLRDNSAETYFCRICDPWRHRAQLRKLRAGEGL